MSMPNWADESEDVNPEELKDTQVEEKPPKKETEKEEKESPNKDNNYKKNYNNNRGKNYNNKGYNNRGNHQKGGGNKYDWNEVSQGRKGKNKFTPTAPPPRFHKPNADQKKKEHVDIKDWFPSQAPFECIISGMDLKKTDDEQEIIDFFKEAAPVEKVTARKDNSSAYVEFKDAESLRKALQLNGKKFQDIIVKVELNTFWAKKESIERKKLELTSDPAKKIEATPSTAYENSSKPNPFGDAKPVTTKEAKEESPKQDDKEDVQDKEKEKDEKDTDSEKKPRSTNNRGNNSKSRGNNRGKPKGSYGKSPFRKEDAAPVQTANAFAALPDEDE